MMLEGLSWTSVTGWLLLGTFTLIAVWIWYDPLSCDSVCMQVFMHLLRLQCESGMATSCDNVCMQVFAHLFLSAVWIWYDPIVMQIFVCMQVCVNLL